MSENYKFDIIVIQRWKSLQDITIGFGIGLEPHRQEALV